MLPDLQCGNLTLNIILACFEDYLIEALTDEPLTALLFPEEKFFGWQVNRH
jgi:hypothetical protein